MIRDVDWDDAASFFPEPAMRRLGLALALMLSTAVANPACAADPVPAPATQRASADDVNRLLKVMDMETMMAGMMEQMSKAQEPMLMQAFGKDLSETDRARMQGLLATTNAIMRKHMAWPVLEPIVRNVYAEVFTRQEVAAMTAFYSSPDGSAILRKSPQAAALTMQALQPVVVAAMDDVKTAVAAELAKKP